MKHTGTTGCKLDVVVTSFNHMDTVWKRSWEDYAEIEGDIINKALDLMNRFPEFTFYLEQAVVLHGFLERFPERRQEVGKRIREGRLEIIGGAWTLADINMALGESLVRNYLVGLGYLKKEFDLSIATGCFADIFGVPAQVPQVLYRFGIKQAWPSRLPGWPADEAGRRKLPRARAKNSDPFLWRAPDGSEVLFGVKYIGCWNGCYEYIPSEETLRVTRERLRAAVERGDRIVLGGLDSEELLPRGVTFRKLIEESARHPDIEFVWSTVGEYLRRVRKAMRRGERKKETLQGEFNPVFTGCYTTRSTVKKANDRLQALLLDADTLAASAVLSGLRIDPALLNEPWRHVIFNQFHDGLCGCHGRYAFLDVMQRYETAERQIAAGFSAIGRKLGSPGDAIFNPLPRPRSGIAALSAEGGAVLVNGQPLPQVQVADMIFTQVPEIPGCGSIAMARDPSRRVARLKTVKSRIVENEFYRITLGSKGVLSIAPLRGDGPVLSGGVGQLLLGEDRGCYWTSRPTGREMLLKADSLRVEAGPLLKRILLKGNCRGSGWDAATRCIWEVEIRLWEGEERLDFLYRVDWTGSGSVLKAAFPVPFGTARADYETPFMVEKRTTYAPEPEAPFNDSRGGEWPSLRFVSVTEKGHGVSLIHHGQHGIRWEPGRFLVSLLRAPADEALRRNATDGLLPDETVQERGCHEYSLSLRLHAGNWIQGRGLPLSESLHHPFRLLESQSELPGLDVQAPAHVGFSTLKTAERGKGLILRLWEGAGRKAVAQIRSPGIRRACRSDLTEIQGPLLKNRMGVWEVPLQPYEIVTVILETIYSV